MRVSSAAGKSERIKTHQCSFYAPNLKEHVVQQWGSTDKFWHLVVNTSQTPYECSITNNRIPITLVKTGYKLLGHQPTTVPPQSMMRCPRKHRLGHALKVLRPSSSGSTLRVKNLSTSSEEALVRGTSHVQCNPLTRPFT
ncbi:hypothetical protein M9H77_35342 [Catharanthus roseus]|uniref:Uncharacterized protein n=1 Tax=Catharanthus roseus TaxID=4058 RepID=A0ACB9ZSZ2_CATRO|nr:hypothetical protein M9H77_35342 [Catharanthus roseus]